MNKEKKLKCLMKIIISPRGNQDSMIYYMYFSNGLLALKLSRNSPFLLYHVS